MPYATDRQYEADVVNHGSITGIEVKTVKGSTEPLRQVPEQLDRMDTVLVALDKALAMLNERLAPVVGGIPIGEGANRSPKAQLVPLAERLELHANRVGEFAQQIMALANSVQL